MLVVVAAPAYTFRGFSIPVSIFLTNTNLASVEIIAIVARVVSL